MTNFNISLESAVYGATLATGIISAKYVFDNSTSLMPTTEMIENKLGMDAAQVANIAYILGTGAYVGYSLYQANSVAAAVSSLFKIVPLLMEQAALIADQGAVGFVCNQVAEQVINIAENYSTPLCEAGQIDYILDNCYTW